MGRREARTEPARAGLRVRLRDPHLRRASDRAGRHPPGLRRGSDPGSRPSRGRRAPGRLHGPRRGAADHLGPQREPEGAGVVAVTRMTLDEALAKAPEVDRAKVDATTEEDIRRHMAEDGAEA